MNVPPKNSLSAMFKALLLVSTTLIFSAAQAQDEATDEASAEASEDAKELGKVVITGSRIARTQVEGPSPVIIIDREQIEREGFTTVQDALKSLSQAGGVGFENEISQAFTPNANNIDLRGLGPGRLLILIDGRRAADYPLPYQGRSNLVNISALPLVAVDRIEVLSGGASAIYGSDAVAGVVNIILRRDLGNSLDLNVRVGDTKEGGMETTRLQAVGGFLGRKWNITYAAEFLDRDPLYAFQRSFMDSSDDSPFADGPGDGVTSLSVIEVELFNFVGVTIPDGGCDAFPQFELGSSSNFGPNSACGNRTDIADQTLVNGRDQYNLYTAGAFELGDSHEIYGSANFFKVDAELDSAFRFYQRQVYDPFSPDTFLLDNFGVPGAYALTQRSFSNSEVGGPILWPLEEEVVDWSVGFRGELFSPLWSYDVIYSVADYTLNRERQLIVEQAASDYFYNDFAGGDPFGFGFPVAELDRANFFSPITPAIFESLTDVSADTASSRNQTLTAVIRGDLWELPAGPIAMAAVLETGEQEYNISLDPQVASGDYYFGITGTGGGGQRERDAIGVEFQIPVTSRLNISAAARQDDYDTQGNTADKLSFNLGVEYRPTSKLLLRGSRSTSFRAPDMHYVFAAPSGFFTSGIDDLYLCRRDEPGVPLEDCTYTAEAIQGTRQGNVFLEEEEGDSLTLGFVWEPTENMSLSADFYDIDLEQAVVDNPLGRILEIEADCRLGIRDINSGECQDALRRVTRNPDDGTFLAERIDSIETGPVNASVLAVQGVDATLQYANQSDSGWRYGFDLGWSHTLSYDFAVFVEDEPNDIRTTGTRDWRSRVRGSTSIGYKDFSATLFGERFGSALSRDNIATGVGRSLGAITNFNLTASYGFLDGKASVSVIVNNLFDRRPQEDLTNGAWPYFDIFSYGQWVIGRTIYGQFRYRFDY